MKTILLIEDNLEMRENTAEILELADYKVLTAENGRVGVDLARDVDPDLIICDVMMPELDGYGVLHILSKNPKTASIPFIFLTAKAEKADFRKGMNLGADDYLTKPFEEAELMDAIEMRMKKSEILKQQFGNDLEGLNQFINEARGLEELNSLSNDRELRTYPKKATIFSEGEFPYQLYFIAKGKVKTFKMNEEGKEFITGMHREGDFIGYLALLEGSPYLESAVALEECEIAIIPKDDFISLLHNNRDVSNKFIKILANNLAETEDRLLKLAYNSVRKRVAEALLMLDKQYSTAGVDHTRISILREDMANIVGTAKETVIRTLRDFKDEGLIDIQSATIVILDRDKLERMKN